MNKLNYFCMIFFFNHILKSEEIGSDINFNIDLIINGNLIVNNTIYLEGPAIFKGQKIELLNNFIIENNEFSNIIFDKNSILQFIEINKFNGIMPLYLIIDNTNNQVFYTDTFNTNVTIDNIIVNNIINNTPNNLIIGNANDTIEIGNSYNNIFFNDILSVNNITSDNENIIINGPINFFNDLNTNNILFNQSNIFIGSNNLINSISINCNNSCNINETIEIHENCQIGNEDLTNNININGTIESKSLTLGSENNYIKTIENLEIIDNPYYYLIKDNDNALYKSINFKFITQNEIINDDLKIKKIVCYNTLTFNTDTMDFISDNINIVLPNTHRKGPFMNLYSNSKFNINHIEANNALSEYRLLSIFSNNIYINPINTNASIVISSFFKSIINDNTGYIIPEIKFNFQNYYFKNVKLNNESQFNIYLNTINNSINTNNNNTTERKNLIFPSNIPILFTYNYKNSYRMKNNDICPKNNKKITHFGFIAEELNKLNIPLLIKYDENNNIYDYNEKILWNILEDKIEEYKNNLINIEKIQENIINYNNNLMMKIKEIQKIINIKKKIYQKIEEYVNKLNKESV